MGKTRKTTKSPRLLEKSRKPSIPDSFPLNPLSECFRFTEDVSCCTLARFVCFCINIVIPKTIRVSHSAFRKFRAKKDTEHRRRVWRGNTRRVTGFLRHLATSHNICYVK